MEEDRVSPPQKAQEEPRVLASWREWVAYLQGQISPPQQR